MNYYMFFTDSDGKENYSNYIPDLITTRKEAIERMKDNDLHSIEIFTEDAHPIGKVTADEFGCYTKHIFVSEGMVYPLCDDGNIDAGYGYEMVRFADAKALVRLERMGTTLPARDEDSARQLGVQILKAHPENMVIEILKNLSGQEEYGVLSIMKGVTNSLVNIVYTSCTGDVYEIRKNGTLKPLSKQKIATIHEIFRKKGIYGTGNLDNIDSAMNLYKAVHAVDDADMMSREDFEKLYNKAREGMIKESE